MKKSLLCGALLVLSVASAAHATPYTIAFQAVPGLSFNEPNFSGTGSFNYDPADGFSNFSVTLDGLSFDLTNSANNPAATSIDACPSSLTGAAFSFEVLTACNTGSFNGSYATPDVGFNFFSNGANITIGFGGPSHQANTGFLYIIYSSLPPLSNQFDVQGSFTVNEVPAVPEPSTLSLLGTGILALGARLRRARRQTTPIA